MDFGQFGDFFTGAFEKDRESLLPVMLRGAMFTSTSKIEKNLNYVYGT